MSFHAFSKHNLFVVIMISLLLPPFFSVIYLFSLLSKYKKRDYLIVFLFFFVLYLTYNFFSIDNVGRFTNASLPSYEMIWLLMDPLTIVLHYGMKYLSLESNHFFLFCIFVIYYFWMQTFTTSVKNRLNSSVLLIGITALSLRYSMDLLYYCLAATFAFWMAAKKEYSLKYLIILLSCVYLLHPGFLLILCPSIGLYYGIKLSLNKKKYIYIVSLIIIYIFAYMISHTTFLNTLGIPFIDVMLESFNSYVGDGAWGQRSGNRMIGGFTYTIAYYLIPSMYFIVFLLSVKYYSSLQNKKILSIFQTAMLFYPNFINFVTLTERTLLVLSLTFILVLFMLKDSKCKTIKLLTNRNVLICCLCISFFNFYKMSGAVKLSNVFRINTYEEIRNRSYYVPSIFLLDYNSYGFSNDYLKRNVDIKSF